MGVDHNGQNRVLRGGSWNNEARNVRAAQRNGNEPGNRNDNIGFRLARARGASELLRDPISIQCVGLRAGDEQHRRAGVRVGLRRSRGSSPARRLFSGEVVG